MKKLEQLSDTISESGYYYEPATGYVYYVNAIDGTKILYSSAGYILNNIIKDNTDEYENLIGRLNSNEINFDITEDK